MHIFKDYLKEKKIELRPWQQELAEEVLIRMKPYRGSAEGKTFIISVLRDFINKHGNDYIIG